MSNEDVGIAGPDAPAANTCMSSEEDRVIFAHVRKPEGHHVSRRGGCEKLYRQLCKRACIMPPDAGE
jgi:hypothetical protein